MVCFASNFDQQNTNQVLVQQRVHNRVNEITEIARKVGSNWVTPEYDRNGNATLVPQPAAPEEGFTCIYDAWNRLVEVKDGETTVAWYYYDGLRRRIAALGEIWAHTPQAREPQQQVAACVAP